MEVGLAVLSELLLFAVISPLLEADLARPWADTLIATDASPVFGFGVSALTVPPSQARRIARHAFRPEGLVITEDEVEGAKERVGRPLRLPCRKSDFRCILSVPRQFEAHSGALETAGISLGLRWWLRSPEHLSQRVVFLVDAQAALFAAAKGRSSAPTLRLEVSKVSALALAGNLSVHYVYIPSEFNPADAPSRGIVDKQLRALL